MTLRHTTECSLVRSTELASILPAKSNGNVSRNPYYYSKVIELLQPVCVALELPCVSPHPIPPRFFAFYTVYTAYGTMKVILFCEFITNHMWSIHFAALVVFRVHNRLQLPQHFRIYCIVPMAPCS